MTEHHPYMDITLKEIKDANVEWDIFQINTDKPYFMYSRDISIDTDMDKIIVPLFSLNECKRKFSSSDLTRVEQHVIHDAKIDNEMPPRFYGMLLLHKDKDRIGIVVVRMYEKSQLVYINE